MVWNFRFLTGHDLMKETLIDARHGDKRKFVFTTNNNTIAFFFKHYQRLWRNFLMRIHSICLHCTQYSASYILKALSVTLFFFCLAGSLVSGVPLYVLQVDNQLWKGRPDAPYFLTKIASILDGYNDLPHRQHHHSRLYLGYAIHFMFLLGSKTRNLGK